MGHAAHPCAHSPDVGRTQGGKVMDQEGQGGGARGAEGSWTTVLDERCEHRGPASQAAGSVGNSLTTLGRQS